MAPSGAGDLPVAGDEPVGGDAPDDAHAPAADDEEPQTWERFTLHLVEAGVVRAPEVEGLRQALQTSGHTLPEILLERGGCDPARLRRELSDFFGVDAVGPEEIPLDPVLMAMFPGDLLARLRCIPLTLVGTTLRVAMVDPSDPEALRELRPMALATLQPVVALERDVKAALENAGVGAGGAGTGAVGDTAFGEALERVGRTLAAGRPEEALAVLAHEIPADPPGGTDGGRRLSFASLEEHRAFAEEHPDREVEWVDPAFGFARYLRGVALGDLGRLEEARAELERAVEWNPVSDRAHLELGWVRARLGRYDEAAAAYARAASLYEGGGKATAALAHRGRGYCLAALGRTEAALAAYRRSQELDGGSEIAKYAVAGLTEPAGAARASASPDDVARLAAATAAGGLAWVPDDDAAADERSFTCSEGGRTITISRRRRRYRLVVRGPGEVPAKVEEEQDGLLRRSRRLKPLYGVVARRTRVLER